MNGNGKHNNNTDGNGDGTTDINAYASHEHKMMSIMRISDNNNANCDKEYTNDTQSDPQMVRWLQDA